MPPLPETGDCSLTISERRNENTARTSRICFPNLQEDTRDKSQT